MDVGEPHVAAAEPVSQPLVVEAEQMQNRRVQSMPVDLVFAGVTAELVRCPVGHSPLYACACQPHGEAEWIMVATDSFRVTAVRKLGRGRAAEFTAPQH